MDYRDAHEQVLGPYMVLLDHHTLHNWHVIVQSWLE